MYIYLWSQNPFTIHITFVIIIFILNLEYRIVLSCPRTFWINYLWTSSTRSISSCSFAFLPYWPPFASTYLYYFPLILNKTIVA